jgi:hypothetical protein
MRTGFRVFTDPIPHPFWRELILTTTASSASSCVITAMTRSDGSGGMSWWIEELELPSIMQQAMTVLLADNLPPVDPQSALLSQALGDALAWRTHKDRRCAECGDDWRDDFCEQCTADCEQANRYHEPARALGVVGDIPGAGPEAGLAGQQPAA